MIKYFIKFKSGKKKVINSEVILKSMIKEQIQTEIHRYLKEYTPIHYIKMYYVSSIDEIYSKSTQFGYFSKGIINVNIRKERRRNKIYSLNNNLLA